MGTSRDFTTGPDTDTDLHMTYVASGSTAVLDRESDRGLSRTQRQGRYQARQDGRGNDRAAQRGGVGTRLGSRGANRPQLPSRTRTPHPSPSSYRGVAQPQPGKTGAAKRLGSKQVVSRRGWRTTPIKKYRRISRVSAIAITMLIAGVALAVWLSGLATAQTFKVQNLTVQESQLNNQLETLNRDLEDVRSTADIAHRAADKNMGIPTHPGIVATKDDGGIDTRRDPEEGMESIIDVNGEPVRPGRASSDPDDTRDVSDNLEATPEGARKREEANGDRDKDKRDAHESRDSHESGDNHGRDGSAERGEAERGDADNGEAEQPVRPNLPAPAPYEARVQ